MDDASASRVGPRFFKIVLQENVDQDQNMLIPKKFTMEHCHGLSKKVTLELPNGDTWLVELVRDDKGRAWFKKGWQQFSQHYCFQHGHFLLFELQGNSHFSVVVLDRTAAEIDYSKFTVNCPGPEEIVPALGRMKVGEDPKGKAPAPAVKFADNAETTQLRPSSSTLPNGSGFAAATAKVRTKQPSFSKVLTRRSSRYGGPNFPLDFVRKYITRSSNEWLQLRVGGRQWGVKLMAYDQHGYSVPSRGWSQFAADNLLNEGDICTFAITTTKTTLDLHIQRDPS